MSTTAIKPSVDESVHQPPVPVSSWAARITDWETRNAGKLWQCRLIGEHHGAEVVQYVQAQRMYATLIERYNPGMGMSEEERVRLSARRVGINLPVEYQEEK